MKQGFENSGLAQEVLGFHCPRWAELPGIALYMDQVTRSEERRVGKECMA